MDGEMLQRILKCYGLQADFLLPVQKGYRNHSYAVELKTGAMANLILYKAESGIAEKIRHANEVSSFVAAYGLPVRQPLDARILRLTGKNQQRYVSVYTYLPGHTIPWEAYTMRHIKLLGQTLGDLHAVLATYTGELTNIATTNLALNGRMIRYFSDAQVAHALDNKLGLKVRKIDFRQLLRACQKLPNQQALHMDFVRGNILFEGKGEALQLTGILDFEKTARGHVLFDIARTLAFLLVDCKYKPQDKTFKYFLHSGYRKRSRTTFTYTAATKRLLNELIAFNLLHDFYKFLRHNPYEYLPQNEHFQRTRNLLQSRNIIE